MSEYLSFDDIDRMGSQLEVYDVQQGAWEHEGQGFEFNATHVLKHLVRDMGRKDFFDGDTVRTEIAPDSLQYALRLARWFGLRRDLLLPRYPAEEQAERFVVHSRLVSRRLAAYGLAQTLLGDFLHNLDHESDRGKAQAQTFDVVQGVGQQLVLSAQRGAREFQFDLTHAFNERLVNLRARFDLPDPTATVSD